MKKLLCLLIALTSISIAFGQELNIKNLKINASRSKTFKQFERFDYQFEIKGTYSSVSLFLYYERISLETSIGVQYWNEDRDDNLVFTNYEVHKTWSPIWSDIAVSLPGKKFILVAKYRGVEKVITYTVPEVSRPTRPTPPSTPANISINKQNSLVFKDCGDNRDCTQIFSGLTGTPIISSVVGSIGFDVVVKNTGGRAASQKSRLSIYRSSDDDFDEDDYLLDATSNRGTRSITIKELGRNEEISASFSFTSFVFSEVGRDDPALRFGNYYLLFVLDQKLLHSIRVNYTRGRRGKQLVNFSSKLEKKQLKILDLTGRIILEKTIESEDDEEEIVKNELNAGLYIIKFGNKSYKIYKN